MENNGAMRGMAEMMKLDRVSKIHSNIMDNRMGGSVDKYSPNKGNGPFIRYRTVKVIIRKSGSYITRTHEPGRPCQF